jgi:hypothetical protein
VILAYPIILKKRLYLPIETKKMLYFETSEVTGGELETATEIVRKDLSNTEVFFRYISMQSEWEESLWGNNTEEMDQILLFRKEKLHF